MSEHGAAALWGDAVRLRANPRYAVISADVLCDTHADVYDEIAELPDVYGVALPNDDDDGRLPWKAVDCDTALLLLSLREPAPLPLFAKRKLGHQAAAVVERLVLDGVLEVERAGTFVSGARAVRGARALGGGVIARLSHAALRYGASLRIDDVETLAGRLYGYHHIPLSPRWAETLASAHDVARFLRIAWGPTAQALGAAWHPTPLDGAERERHWFMWHPRGTPGRRATGTPTAAYKLYVSPAVEHVAEALRVVVETLAPDTPVAFKIGASATGLLRPDKMVFYLGSLDEVSALGGRLRAALRGVPAHGVPFTAPLDDTGLLSWGADPYGVDWSVGAPAQSWRSRIATRLAASLVVARRQGVERDDAVAFAMERLRRDGVDVDTWAPRSHEWEAAFAHD